MAASPAKRPASAVYLLFVLTDVALASATCPGGWTRFDEGGKCYKVTAGRFNALGCATACGENASLACIRSSAEADFVASLTRSAGDVWIGLYQSAGGAEPGGGWDTCASGEATNFTNWRDGFPSNFAFDAAPASIRSKQIFCLGVAISAVVAFSAPAISVPLSAAAFVAVAAFSAAAALSDPNIWGVDQQCAAKTRAFLQDEWFDHPCYHPYQCLCELGAPASAEYLSFIEADIEEGQKQLRWSAVFLYGLVIPAAWIFTPAFFICTVLTWSRLRCSLLCSRRQRAANNAIEAPRTEAIPKDESHAPAVATTGSAAHASTNTEAKLADAEAKGRRLRMRVSGTFVQLAWMLLCLGFSNVGPWFGVDLTLIAGAAHFYPAALPWGIGLLVLGLRPTDAKAISIACAFIFALLLCGTVVFFIIAVGEAIIDPARALNLIIPCIYPVCAALVWPTLNVVPSRRTKVARLAKLTKLAAEKAKKGAAERAMRAEEASELAETDGGEGKLTEDERKEMKKLHQEMKKLQQKLAPMPPRRQLLRLWRAFRLASFGIALLFLAFCLYELLKDPFQDPNSSKGPSKAIVVSASWLIASLVFSPANRGRVVSWLSALGKSHKAENEAAVLAALFNNLSATEALKQGTKRFRALPLAKLTPEDIPGSRVLTGYSQGMSAAAQPTKELFEKTEKATLHEVDAFISHSWSDDGDAKYDQIKKWADGRDVSIWLDKACLDQSDITTSLAGLPVFLAGCKELLVLAGPTYASRLWCVMEIFVFLRMGVRVDVQEKNMVVRLLSGTDDGLLQQKLRNFDAGTALCFDPNDRERLWAVIEAAFGTFDLFNKIVRDMFDKKLQNFEA